MNLPNDTNHLNNLFGGRPMEWMDVIAAISAIVIAAWLETKGHAALATLRNEYCK